MWASERASSAVAPQIAATSAWRALLALGATLLCTLAAPASPAVPAAQPPDPAAQLLDLDALRGRVVYLDFWASWCVPCRQSFPWMNRLQQELAPQGLVIVAVNVDRERGAADRFLRGYAPRFRIVFDPEGLLPERFGVRGMPTSFLIDREGHVRSRHEGFRVADRDTLAGEIRALVLAHPVGAGAN